MTTGSLDFAQELGAEVVRRALERRAVTWHGQVGGYLSRWARSVMQATRMSSLLPTSAYSARLETWARVAISRVVVSA